ncbi:MAG: DUF2167 domain-containing protein [Planctomycetota bacterium]
MRNDADSPRCAGMVARALIAGALAGALTGPLAAQDSPAPTDTAPAQEQLGFETGKVTVKGGVATIDLPEGWRYLQQRDARHVVEKVWGNPPDPGTLGLVVPPGEGHWAIIVSYSDEGYVSDSDASTIDYGDLLKQMQSGAKEENAQRKKQGYPTVELLGWAEKPHYDSVEKKLYWAKSLRFGDEGGADTTLNYDVRVLGADGYLEMSAVAAVSELDEVSKGAKEILARTELAAGKRYADHDPKLHKVAAYGIGGLIAGKLLLKGGLFKLLLKPLLIAGAAIVAFAGKLFGKKKKAASAEA